MQNLDYQDWHM